MKLSNLKYVPLLVPAAVIIILGAIFYFLAWILDGIVDFFCRKEPA
jgi:hypothetical protein